VKEAPVRIGDPQRRAVAADLALILERECLARSEAEAADLDRVHRYVDRPTRAAPLGFAGHKL
jgi:hypothetical protein